MYWSPGDPMLGVVKTRLNLQMDWDEYIHLLTLRIEEMLDREGENRDLVIADAREILDNAFGRLAYLNPKDWLKMNVELRERLLHLGLGRRSDKIVRASENQAELKELYEKTSLLQWLNALTGDLDEHLT